MEAAMLDDDGAYDRWLEDQEDRAAQDTDDGDEIERRLWRDADDALDRWQDFKREDGDE